MKCYLPMKVEPLFTMVAYVFLTFNIIEKHSSWVNTVKSIPFYHPFFSWFCSIERYAEIYLLSPIIVGIFPSFAHLVETKKSSSFLFVLPEVEYSANRSKIYSQNHPFHVLLFKAPQPLLSDIGGLPCVGVNV